MLTCRIYPDTGASREVVGLVGANEFYNEKNWRATGEAKIGDAFITECQLSRYRHCPGPANCHTLKSLVEPWNRIPLDNLDEGWLPL